MLPFFINVELMWELMSFLPQKNKMEALDGQARLNSAMKQCGIQWQSLAHIQSHLKTRSVSGHCSLEPYQKVRVSVLPVSSICYKCLKRTNSYVTHLEKENGKLKTFNDLSSWFLSMDWAKVGEGLKGTEWLASLMNKTNFNQRLFATRMAL